MHSQAGDHLSKLHHWNKGAANTSNNSSDSKLAPTNTCACNVGSTVPIRAGFEIQYANTRTHKCTHTPRAHHHQTGRFFLRTSYDKTGADWNKRKTAHRLGLCSASEHPELLASLPHSSLHLHHPCSVLHQVKTSRAYLPGWNWWHWSHLLGRGYRLLRPHNWQK